MPDRNVNGTDRNVFDTTLQLLIKKENIFFQIILTYQEKNKNQQKTKLKY